MNKIKTLVLVGMLPIFIFAKDKKANEIELEMLRDAGATSYSVLADDAYIGFSKDNKALVAVNSKKFKSYSVITICVAVKKDGNNFIISDAKITDIDKIKDKKKRDNVTSAIADIKGKQIFTEKKEYKNIDAITGATRYHSAVYENGNLLAKDLLATLQKNLIAENTIAIPEKKAKSKKDNK